MCRALNYRVMEFQLFVPQDALAITSGNLPHWYQPGVTYFVTFRTEDSIPKQVADLWHRRRDEWLRRHGIDPEECGFSAALNRLPASKLWEFHQVFSQEYLDYLDRGYGGCVLAQPAAANLVAETLLHFHGDRYLLGDFVVMPNHVHLLVGLLGQTEITSLCYSWKKYSAGRVNRLLGRNGRFWQEESFDHLVRSAAQFERFQSYIAANPAKAGLQDGQFLLRPYRG